MCGLTRVEHHKFTPSDQCLYEPSPFVFTYASPEVVSCIEMSQQYELSGELRVSPGDRLS